LIQRFSDSTLTKEWDFNLPQQSGDDDRWFVSRAKLLYDAQNRPNKIVGVSIDITERKQMQKEVEKSEYILRKVIETIPVGLWIADQNGRITVANPEAKRIWGGVKFVDIDQYGDYKGWWEHSGEEVGSEGWTLARAVKHGEVSKGEIVNIKGFDGVERRIIMSAIPLFNDKNKIIGAIEVNQDITEIKDAK
jgi:PAS domain S-box-containing protein